MLWIFPVAGRSYAQGLASAANRRLMGKQTGQQYQPNQQGNPHSGQKRQPGTHQIIGVKPETALVVPQGHQLGGAHGLAVHLNGQPPQHRTGLAPER